tara:strand:+ start:3491 stop:3652 length:162 start_codon:yes stop_codon:yes gene_type:complete
MPTYTRKHYVDIGNTIKKLPKKARTAEYNKWNRKFKKDNPRYDSKRFKKHVGV